MKLSTRQIVALCGLGFFGLLVLIAVLVNALDPVAPAKAAAVDPAVAARQKFVEDAEFACLNWAEHNAPMRVDEASASGTELPGAKLKPGQVRVRSVFRVGADGVPMAATCTVSQDKLGFWIDRAKLEGVE